MSNYFPLVEVKPVNTKNGPMVLAVFENYEEEIKVWMPENDEKAKIALTFEVGKTYPLEKKGQYWRIANEVKSFNQPMQKSGTLPPINDFIESRTCLYLTIYQQVMKQVSKQGLSISDKIIESLVNKVFDQTIGFYGDIPKSIMATQGNDQLQARDNLMAKVKTREIDTSEEMLMARYEKKSINDLTIAELEDLVNTTNFDVGEEVVIDEKLVEKISAKIYEKIPEMKGKKIQITGIITAIKDEGNCVDLMIKDGVEPFDTHQVSVKSLGLLTPRQI